MPRPTKTHRKFKNSQHKKPEYKNNKGSLLLDSSRPKSSRTKISVPATNSVLGAFFLLQFGKVAQLVKGAPAALVGDTSLCFNNMTAVILYDDQVPAAAKVIAACGGQLDATACAKPPFGTQTEVCTYEYEDADRVVEVALTASAGGNAALYNCVSSQLLSALCSPSELDWVVPLVAGVGVVAIGAGAYAAIKLRPQLSACLSGLFRKNDSAGGEQDAGLELLPYSANNSVNDGEAAPTCSYSSMA